VGKGGRANLGNFGVGNQGKKVGLQFRGGDTTKDQKQVTGGSLKTWQGLLGQGRGRRKWLFGGGGQLNPGMIPCSESVIWGEGGVKSQHFVPQLLGGGKVT